MCNLYGSTHEEGVRKYWRPANVLASPWEGGIVAPESLARSSAARATPRAI
jgi:hypothetical protein